MIQNPLSGLALLRRNRQLRSALTLMEYALEHVCKMGLSRDIVADVSMDRAEPYKPGPTLSSHNDAFY